MKTNYISTIDTIPFNNFKNLVHNLKYSIFNLISKLLNDGIMYKKIKYAIIKPILKKTSLDPDVITNYIPISQLPIISKIMK